MVDFVERIMRNTKSTAFFAYFVLTEFLIIADTAFGL